MIPDGTPGVYPLSSTVIPDHIPGDGGAGGVAGGAAADPGGGATGTSRSGGTNGPDGEDPDVEHSAGLSNSFTLSSSSTLYADDLRTFSLTEVSLNSTLVALTRSTGDEATTAVVHEVTNQIQTMAAAGGVASLDVGGQQAGIQESVKHPVVKEAGKKAGVQVIRKGEGVRDTTKGKGVQEVASKTVKNTKLQVTSKNVAVDDLGARNIGSQLDRLHRSPSPLVTKEDICQIVRTEIEPILQVSFGKAVKYPIDYKTLFLLSHTAPAQAAVKCSPGSHRGKPRS